MASEEKVRITCYSAANLPVYYVMGGVITHVKLSLTLGMEAKDNNKLKHVC
jgi:hypothetical protein